MVAVELRLLGAKCLAHKGFRTRIADVFRFRFFCAEDGRKKRRKGDDEHHRADSVEDPGIRHGGVQKK